MEKITYTHPDRLKELATQLADGVTYRHVRRAFGTPVYHVFSGPSGFRTTKALWHDIACDDCIASLTKEPTP